MLMIGKEMPVFPSGRMISFGAGAESAALSNSSAPKPMRPAEVR
jgi:hypothetical protein